MTRLLLLLLVCLGIVDAEADSKNGELEVRRIAEGVYLHTSYHLYPDAGYFPSNGLIIVDDSEAYLVDTAWSEEDTAKLLAWAEEKGVTIKAAVITHFHDDRSVGLPVLNAAGIKTYASARTNYLLEQAGFETAQTGFRGDGVELKKGVAVAYFAGVGHTEDNLVVWLPKHKLLFGGCFVRPKSSSSLGNTADASIGEWLKSAERLAAAFPDVDIVVPGHGEPGDASLFTHTIDLLRD